MLIKQNLNQLDSITKSYLRLFLLICFVFVFHAHSLYGNDTVCSIGKNLKNRSGESDKQTLVYYLNISDFAQSFIEIPTSNLLNPSPTLDSSYLAGRAPIYDVNNVKAGICSASFLNIQTADGIFQVAFSTG